VTTAVEWFQRYRAREQRGTGRLFWSGLTVALTVPLTDPLVLEAGRGD
jgi:hypothetical protein